MNVTIDPRLIQLAILEAPAALDALKALFVKRNPDAPEPTSAEVIAAHQFGVAATLAKDDQFLAQHVSD